MVDGIILFILFVMFFIGFSRGTWRQLWSLAVLALATFLSGIFYKSFTDLVGSVVSDPSTTNLIGFALVFGLVSGVLNAVADSYMHYRHQHGKRPGFVNSSIGSVLGLIEGFAFVEVVAAAVLAFPVLGLDSAAQASKLLGAFFNSAPVVMPLLPEVFQQILPLFK